MKKSISRSPDTIWRPQPYIMKEDLENYPYLLIDPVTPSKPENCRNCGSAHTRIKKGVTICSYCGSRSD